MRIPFPFGIVQSEWCTPGPDCVGWRCCLLPRHGLQPTGPPNMALANATVDTRPGASIKHLSASCDGGGRCTAAWHTVVTELSYRPVPSQARGSGPPLCMSAPSRAPGRAQSDDPDSRAVRGRLKNLTISGCDVPSDATHRTTDLWLCMYVRHVSEVVSIVVEKRA